MKLINAADSRPIRKGGLECSDLSIVRGNEEKVLQFEWFGDAIRCRECTAQQLLVNRRHPFDLFITLLNVAFVFDADENNSAFLGDDPLRSGHERYPLLCAIRVRPKAILVDALRNEAAY